MKTSARVILVVVCGMFLNACGSDSSTAVGPVSAAPTQIHEGAAIKRVEIHRKGVVVHVPMNGEEVTGFKEVLSGASITFLKGRIVSAAWKDLGAARNYELLKEFEANGAVTLRLDLPLMSAQAARIVVTLDNGIEVTTTIASQDLQIDSDMIAGIVPIGSLPGITADVMVDGLIMIQPKF